MDEVRTSPTRNPRADAAKARLRTSTFPAKHKRALWGCIPPRDSGNGCDAGVGRQVKGMKRATARPCPLRFFHRMHSRSAGVLCHASKILGSEATPRPSPNPRPRPLWNNPKTYDHSDRKTRPQFGQSLKITRSQSGKTVQHQFGSQHPPTTIAVFGLISKPRLGWKRQAWRFRHPGCVIALVLIHGAPFSFTKKPPCIKPDEGAVTKQDIGDLSATPESQNAHKQFPPPRPGGVGSGRSSLGDFGGERGRAAASSAGIGVATPDKTPFQAMD